ncbi:hypothetical protein [Streptomyces sp. NPDC059122]|uniref:hypothetical protein n=1 Tax=Streptomyces sp. NPDC059122 TaxID=3346732 RepID=UPI003674C239
MFAQLPHDLQGKVLAGFAVLRLIGDVLGKKSKVLRQPMQWSARAGQPQRPHLGEVAPKEAAGHHPFAGGKSLCAVQVGEPVEEGGDVVPAERAKVLATVLALQAKALGEHREGADDVLDGGHGSPAALGKGGEGQLLDRFAHPGLMDVGEVQAAGVTEDRAVPYVLRPFVLRRLSDPVDEGDQVVVEATAAAGEFLRLHRCQCRKFQLSHAVEEVSQQGLTGVESGLGPGLEAVEHFRHQAFEGSS